MAALLALPPSSAALFCQPPGHRALVRPRWTRPPRPAPLATVRACFEPSAAAALVFRQHAAAATFTRVGTASGETAYTSATFTRHGPAAVAFYRARC